jgi:hypothetical protein
LVIVVLAMASAAIPALRSPMLRAVGGALVVADDLGPADIVVVGTGADGAGVLAAADLVHGGVAAQVAVFADPPDPSVDREFIRRGIPYEDAAARAIRQLKALGVDNVRKIPRALTGTEDEGRVFPEWCDQNHFRSVVVVTTSDHSRRLRRVLRRSMNGHETRVTVHPARYSPFDPNRWWETRGGTRTEVVELEKLLLDILLHPIS